MLSNEEIAKQIALGNAGRDAMLAHLIERLKTLRTLQTRELLLLQRGANFAWWRLASDRKRDEEQAPDPKQWKLPAQLYEKAALQLCRGDLRAGRELMERAMRAERELLDNLTSLVDTRDIDAEPDGALLATLADTPACGGCPVPQELQIAKDIQRVSDDIREIPGRRIIETPWWTAEEEEEGEGDDRGTP